MARSKVKRTVRIDGADYPIYTRERDGAEYVCYPYRKGSDLYFSSYADTAATYSNDYPVPEMVEEAVKKYLLHRPGESTPYMLLSEVEQDRRMAKVMQALLDWEYQRNLESRPPDAPPPPNLGDIWKSL